MFRNNVSVESQAIISMSYDKNLIAMELCDNKAIFSKTGIKRLAIIYPNYLWDHSCFISYHIILYLLTLHIIACVDKNQLAYVSIQAGIKLFYIGHVAHAIIMCLLRYDSHYVQPTMSTHLHA